MSKKGILKRKRLNTYDENSLEYEVYSYFSHMDVYLKDEKLKEIVKGLADTPTKDFFKRLDELQLENNALASNYNSCFLEELRIGRYDVQKLKDNVKGVKRAVKRYTLEGEYIDTFQTLADASYAVIGTNKAIGAISNTANGLGRQSRGFVWEFDDSFKQN